MESGLPEPDNVGIAKAKKDGRSSQKISPDALAVLRALLDEGAEGSHTFDASLSSAERRRIHLKAQQFGLLSESSGSGSERRLTIFRPGAPNAPAPRDPTEFAQGRPREEQLSRMLTSILRHRAEEEGLEVGPDGFACLADILDLPDFQDKGFTEQEVRDLVSEKDHKKRFQICPDSAGVWIRANQGHTIKGVQDSRLLEPILSSEEVPCCVHGTYLLAWHSILEDGGLSRMSRNHIHFAPSPPGGGHVISGMRPDVEVAIYVSVASCLASGIEFFRSSNNVLLTRGDDNGMVPMEHIEKAVTVPEGKRLWPRSRRQKATKDPHAEAEVPATALEHAPSPGQPYADEPADGRQLPS